jgi:hypothetical protein
MDYDLRLGRAARARRIVGSVVHLHPLPTTLLPFHRIGDLSVPPWMAPWSPIGLAGECGVASDAVLHDAASTPHRRVLLLKAAPSTARRSRRVYRMGRRLSLGLRPSNPTKGILCGTTERQAA